MATAEQIKSLVKAHFSGDKERFKTAALRIAASEAKQGHTSLARDITAMVDSPGSRSKIINIANKDNLFLVSKPENKRNDLVVSPELSEKICRIVNEYGHREKLAAYGLSCRRKILLEGEPGTGKTMTASVLASAFGLPLYTVQMDKLITKYLGETSVKLRQIFEAIQSNRGVYFFDEFDAIGADRSLDNEVGEMRRILNSFLQFIESDASGSLIVAATNNRKMLDQALFRRFDDVLHYELPSEDEIRKLVASRVSGYDSAYAPNDEIVEDLKMLCQADIVRLCDDAIKESLLSGSMTLSDEAFSLLCADRLAIYSDKMAG